MKPPSRRRRRQERLSSASFRSSFVVQKRRTSVFKISCHSVCLGLSVCRSYRRIEDPLSRRPYSSSSFHNVASSLEARQLVGWFSWDVRTVGTYTAVDRGRRQERDVGATTTTTARRGGGRDNNRRRRKASSQLSLRRRHRCESVSKEGRKEGRKNERREDTEESTQKTRGGYVQAESICCLSERRAWAATWGLGEVGFLAGAGGAGLTTGGTPEGQYASSS